jgi:hypothetical protein
MVELDCNFVTRVMKFLGSTCYEKKTMCIGQKNGHLKILKQLQ